MRQTKKSFMVMVLSVLITGLISCSDAGYDGSCVYKDIYACQDTADNTWCQLCTNGKYARTVLGLINKTEKNVP